MRALLRKVRGALGVGLTWAVVWAAIFAVTVAIVGVFDPDSIDAGEGPSQVAVIGGIFGFISGVAFATLLALSERRKSIRDLSLGRAALWGALGTAAFPLLTPVANSMVFILCPIGAAIAAGSVAAARRLENGEQQKRQLPL